MKKYSVCDILLPILALCFLLGLFFAFGPCGPKEDGSWMTCHWAGQAEKGTAGLLLALTLLHLIPGRAEMKTGLDLAQIGVCVLTLLLPGRLIGLCMMHDMRCRSVMTPAVTVFAVLVIAVSLVDLLLKRKRT